MDPVHYSFLLWYPWTCNVLEESKRLGRQNREWAAGTAAAEAGSREVTCRQLAVGSDSGSSTGQC